MKDIHHKSDTEGKLLLSVGSVFRCKPEEAEGILDYIKSRAELIYIKQSYGRLWIKESIPEISGDCEGESFGND